MKVYQLGKMTWPEVEEALQTVKMAVIPVGAHEQHGPHMTENCDAVLAEKMAILLGEKLHPYTVITPVINLGISPHHMNFPGTITLQPETMLSVIKDVVSSLKEHGIKKFLLLNAHGGNQSILGVASTKLSLDLNVEIYYAKTTASAKDVIEQYTETSLYGHSCEREVSEALYLAPEIVRKDRLTKGNIQHGGRWEQLRPGQPIQGFYKYEEMTANGAIGNATIANEDIGRHIVQTSLERLSKDLLSLMEINAHAGSKS
ncbi:creatininase family protein [Alteribacillus iranensis]|uniref:Creatinine amidohydrolase n=1 Tax=Alteribacillus iranensis TaxID=930128 RepID=A0A1I2E504_9BACI|nr:creatininase family protein [Alteribacillus iranensis]SFE87729.1 creatinine amidohydrolase [Alteribacillus iranensis]